MIGNSHEYIKDQGLGGRNLDARAQYFYMATFNSPAMVWKLIGKGSQYAWGYLDKQWRLSGRRQVLQAEPSGDAPAKKFMSVVVYDSQTRSMLQTGQPYPNKNNKRDKMMTPTSRRIDRHLLRPQGSQGERSQLDPDAFPIRAGSACCVSTARLEPWFDKTWRPGDIEPVQ